MRKFRHIGERLRQAILTVPNRNELARLAGVTPSNISYFVTGKRDITMGTGAKIAAVLGMELVQTGKSKIGKAVAAKGGEDAKRSGGKAGRR